MTSSLELVIVACIVRVPSRFFRDPGFPFGFSIGIARNFGSGLRDWRTQLGTIYCNIIDQSKRCVWMEEICLGKSRKRPKISHSSIDCYFDTSIVFDIIILLLIAITTSKYKNTKQFFVTRMKRRRERKTKDSSESRSPRRLLRRYRSP